MDAGEVLKRIEDSSHELRLPIIGPAKGEILDGVIREHKPERALEIGTLVGYSAIRTARLLPKGGRLTCVEVSKEMAEVAQANLRDAGLDDRVEILVGDAKMVLPSLKGSYDMVLIDATKSEYLQYLKACERLLHVGSVVVADNIKEFQDTLAPYVEYVRHSGLYKSHGIDAPLNANPSFTDAMEISVRL